MTETTAIITRPTAQDYARANRATNTYRAYRAAWRRFAAWCAEHHCPALPADALAVADYLAHAAQRHKPSTLAVHVAAIAAAHKAAGHPDPTADERVAATMRGIRRVHGQPPTQREPLTLDDLRAMLRACGDDLPGLRDRALLLVGFAGALRRSELVALDVEHIRLNGVLRITIARSKTDQEGQGITKTSRAWPTLSCAPFARCGHGWTQRESPAGRCSAASTAGARWGRDCRPMTWRASSSGALKPQGWTRVCWPGIRCARVLRRKRRWPA